MNVLGIETSCDETAAAVVADGRRVLSDVLFSQVAQHRPFGGVVPELASRSHTEVLPGIVRRAVGESGVGWAGIDAVAATHGPGLASSLLVGVVAAKALGLALRRPLLAVHHLEAHLYSVYLADPPPARDEPLLALVVSGGHTCLLALEPGAGYRLLGQTLDDAAGEALDKGANLLGLGYPGGPAIERAAEGGDPGFVAFPRGQAPAGLPGAAPSLERDLCFSFSGLKTALRYYLKDHPDPSARGTLAHVAASYQEAVVEALVERLRRAAERTGADRIACAGGVARNRRLRGRLEETARALGARLHLAPPAFCTDNAAMVAAAAGGGYGRPVEDPDALDIHPGLSLG